MTLVTGEIAYILYDNRDSYSGSAKSDWLEAEKLYDTAVACGNTFVMIPISEGNPVRFAILKVTYEICIQTQQGAVFVFRSRLRT